MIQLAEAMRDAFEAAEKPFEKWIASSGRPVSCRRGCAACCELLALATWPECSLIAEHLREHGLVQKFLPRLVDHARRCDFPGLDQRSYFDARIPCAFLEPDSTCGVYAARPAPCRYHVVYSPPELCELRTPGTQTVGCDEAEPIRLVVLPILEQAARQVGNDAYLSAPIPIMVLEALRQLGEKVPSVIQPKTWLRRHGGRVSKYNRRERAARREVAHGGKKVRAGDVDVGGVEPSGD